MIEVVRYISVNNYLLGNGCQSIVCVMPFCLVMSQIYETDFPLIIYLSAVGDAIVNTVNRAPAGN